MISCYINIACIVPAASRLCCISRRAREDVFPEGGARDKTLLRKGVPLHLKYLFSCIVVTSPRFRWA